MLCTLLQYASFQVGSNCAQRFALQVAVQPLGLAVLFVDGVQWCQFDRWDLPCTFVRLE